MSAILAVVGTRPEAIKLFPVIRALRARGLDTKICLTGQHPEMVWPTLAMAGLDADFDLALPNDAPSRTFEGRLLGALESLIGHVRPVAVLVQGDTFSAKAAALAGFLQGVRVAHVEAGLRTRDIWSPWPEEANRRVISSVARWHFAPTQVAARALCAEVRAGASVHVTGNTVVDALHWMREQLSANPGLSAHAPGIVEAAEGRSIILVTAHRRENHGAPLERVAAAVRRVAQREDVFVVLPLHPNPEARRPLQGLGNRSNIRLLEPLSYPDLVHLLIHCRLVLTDSGGLQEEAPVLGKPVLVMRNDTERPEGVLSGTAQLVGSDDRTIADAVFDLLDNADRYARVARPHSPYGDGQASGRIAAILRDEI